ncbi:MAG TPA: threonine/serine dehydratase [Thermoanaerobaculia bacterium]|jgi:threonine dehydratase|nr:threonine/serine dehydratase [Thermoanaerobaculia bacterium]
MSLPISFADALAARERILPYLQPTPLRSYEALDAEIGGGIRVLVKHENHQPTNAFKIRNALSALTLLSAGQRRRGVVAATRGNHGQGVALAGRLLGVPVTVCVPVGNSPGKNLAIRGFGAELIEQGRDYDESVEVAQALVRERGLHLVHSTNDPAIVAGAATIGLEILEQAPDVEAILVAIGGGSQAVGALVAASGLRPDLQVFGVQAAGAPAQYEGWRAGRPLVLERADTFADGLATRGCYDLTFAALRAGLSDFVAATEGEIADAVRLVLRTTHNLAEGAGAASFAGLRLLRDRLAGRKVAVVLSGSNIDEETLRRVLNGEL